MNVWLNCSRDKDHCEGRGRGVQPRIHRQETLPAFLSSLPSLFLLRQSVVESTFFPPPPDWPEVPRSLELALSTVLRHVKVHMITGRACCLSLHGPRWSKGEVGASHKNGLRKSIPAHVPLTHHPPPCLSPPSSGTHVVGLHITCTNTVSLVDGICL